MGNEAKYVVRLSAAERGELVSRGRVSALVRQRAVGGTVELTCRTAMVLRLVRLECSTETTITRMKSHLTTRTGNATGTPSK